MAADAYTRLSESQRRLIYGEAKRQGLDQELLHARCRNVTGAESIGSLTVGQAAKLIDSLKGKRGGPARLPDPRPLERCSQGQINMILGIVRKMGWLEGGSRSRLNGFLRQRFGVERLDWLTPEQARKVIEALKAMLKQGRMERSGSYEKISGAGMKGQL